MLPQSNMFWNKGTERVIVAEQRMKRMLNLPGQNSKDWAIPFPYGQLNDRMDLLCLRRFLLWLSLMQSTVHHHH